MSSLSQFKREIRNANGKLLAFDIRSGYGSALTAIFERIGRGNKVYDSEIREMMDARGDRGFGGLQMRAGPNLVQAGKSNKMNAVVPLRGVATYATEAYGYCFSTLKLSQNIAQLAGDPSIATIILDIDTPGGHVTGTQEAADAVWAAQKVKPVIGIINPLCASAGYWIASQCSSIIGVPSADIGSIGVFMCHYDCSAMLADSGIKPTFIYAGEHKVEGNSMEPLAKEAKAFFQQEVNKTYLQFLQAVARGRGVSVATVRDGFGAGRCFAAPDALRAGMIDSISTLDQAMQRIVAGTVPSRVARSPSAAYRARLAELAKDPAPNSRHAVLARARLAVLQEG